MKAQVTAALIQEAKRVAEFYSDPERSQNFNAETFEVCEIIPLSEFTAAVIYLKNTGKKAAFFFYYIAPKETWWHFVPTDSHILGMENFPKVKLNVERHNIEIERRPE